MDGRQKVARSNAVVRLARDGMGKARKNGEETALNIGMTRASIPIAAGFCAPAPAGDDEITGRGPIESVLEYMTAYGSGVRK